MKASQIIYFAMLSYVANVQAQSFVNDSFHIKGTFIGKYKGYIYLKYANKLGKSIKDSCLINNGKFTLKGQVNCYTSFAFLSLNSQGSTEVDLNEARIDLDNSNINITTTYNDFEHMKITGVRTLDTLRKYSQRKRAVLKKIKYYEKLLDSSKNEVERMKINKQLEYYKQLGLKKDIAYLKQHSNSNISSLLLYNNLQYLSLVELTNTYYSLSLLQQQSYYGKSVYSILTNRKWNIEQPGTKAPVFSAIDINERPVKLDNIYKNKYVLLDFWASWCNPCRVSHPFLRTIYNKYADKGFEIIGIASDVGKEPQWRKAVEQDNITSWINVLRTIDRKEINSINDIQEMYHVQYLPTRILIDTNGVIIGRYMDEEKLNQKLQEIFQ